MLPVGFAICWFLSHSSRNFAVLLPADLSLASSQQHETPGHHPVQVFERQQGRRSFRTIVRPKTQVRGSVSELISGGSSSGDLSRVQPSEAQTEGTNLSGGEEGRSLQDPLEPTIESHQIGPDPLETGVPLPQVADPLGQIAIETSPKNPGAVLRKGTLKN